MPPSDSCQRCQSTRLYAFAADPNARVEVGALPVVCRDCGLITIAGVAVSFPPEFEQQAKKMADAAADTGKAIGEELAKDPNPKIALYFAKVYRGGYLDGFWRAIAFFKHNNKEGRLIRLRDLWARRREWIDQPEPELVVLEMPKTVYAEFARLLELGDVARTENKGPSVS